MIRTLATIALAIATANPRLPAAATRSHAAVLRAHVSGTGLDPLDVVAIIWEESGWRSGAISPDGEDVGLGQIRVRHLPGCRRDPDPVRNPGPDCRAARASLLDPANNMRLTVQALTRWRSICRKKVGRTDLASFLAGYGGLNSPAHNHWCGWKKSRGKWVRQPHPGVRRALEYRRRLRA
jgi:hypothetical protein